MEELEKLDIIRERTGLSYKESKEALDEAGGNVVQALIDIESRERSLVEKLQERGQQVMGQVRTYVNKSTHGKIKIKKDDRTLLEIPTSVGALGLAGVLMSGELAVVGAIGAVAAMANKINFEYVDKDKEEDPTGVKRNSESNIYSLEKGRLIDEDDED